MSFQSYEAYKQANLPWITKVPEHWDLCPLKTLLSIENGADHSEILAEEGWPVFGSGGAFAKASQYLYDGETVLLGRKGTVDKPLYYIGKFWTVDTMYWSRIKPGCNGRYAYYSCLTIPFGYYQTSTALPSMTKALLGSHTTCSPPLKEQLAIACFLDKETTKIDALIAEQERLIELLQEKRQAVISHAVTKGLNPSVPMKDSGVEWLGEVPVHWERLPIFRAARQDHKCFTDGDWIESPFITEEGVRLIQTGNIGIGIYREKGFKFVSNQTFEDLKCTEIETGDLLICRLDGPVGRACLAPDLGVKMITSVDNAILKTRENISTEFLMYIFSSLQWLEWIQAICRVGGGFRLRISRTQLGEQRICIPPIDEQIEICDQIRSESKKIDDLTSSASQSIELLKERRSALISAAVTGQIDVRGLIPEEEAA